jgi:hypothetical protein
MTGGADRGAKGRIPERIVTNELEFRGFRVTNLNKEGGVEANADLLAAKEGRIWQIQVKGSFQAEHKEWWFQYGFCNDAIIGRTEKMFNRRQSFYTAGVIVLVGWRTPCDYCCVVMPIAEADRAVELNLDWHYRGLKPSGEPYKPHMVWGSLVSGPRAKPDEVTALSKEREILNKY